MFMNLFMIFDPVTLIFSMNWISMFYFIIIFPQMFWYVNSRLIYMINYFMFMLINEFKVILVKNMNINNLIFIKVLFFYIMFNNLMGLFPYVFTSSSHLLFSLIFSLSMWVSFNLYGWVKNLYMMLIHLVPLGTPMILMIFMVVIELLSNIIRPLTLSVRLMANMISGHLLLVLLSNFLSTLFMMYFFMFLVQIMLLMLELMVSLIQSYVFVILLVLYMKEFN